MNSCPSPKTIFHAIASGKVTKGLRPNGGWAGLEFGVIWSRISRETWLPDFACLGHGFCGLGLGFFVRSGSRILRGRWGEMGCGSGVLWSGSVVGVSKRLAYRLLAWNLCLLGGPARVSSMLSQILSGGVYMPVEGSVYSLCERKSALISGRAASIFRI